MKVGKIALQKKQEDRLAHDRSVLETNSGKELNGNGVEKKVTEVRQDHLC